MLKLAYVLRRRKQEDSRAHHEIARRSGLPREAVHSRNGSLGAVARFPIPSQNSLFDRKNSLFSAEQGIGRKLLNLLGDRLSKRAKAAGIVRNLQEIPC